MLSEENKKIYSSLKGYLDREWRKKEQCIGWLNSIFNIDISERSFRAFVAEFNQELKNGNSDMFIAHSNNGYLLTSDADIIMNSINDNKSRAITMLDDYYGVKKALSMRNQIKLTPDETDMYELVSRMQTDIDLKEINNGY